MHIPVDKTFSAEIFQYKHVRNYNSKMRKKTILMRRRKEMKREFTREQKEVLDILAAESYEAWIEDMETATYLESTFAGKGEYSI